MDRENISILARSLEVEMLSQHGPMLSGDALRKVLGFATMDGFRKAIVRNKLPIPVFSLENRRGKYALVKDVAVWLAEQRYQAK